MATCLALLSGKGGSGKTTLALSLAQLLAVCDIKTLLIDCDMSTHGATYFFEDMFIDNNKIYTFSELLLNQEDMPNSIYDDSFLVVKNNLHFMPSCTIFPNNFYETYNSKYITDHLKTFINMSQMYDVILFDCQAGYNNITESVLKLSDKNLVILEPDAVSVIAIRVLYAQCFELLNQKKTYQVFNKLLPEEIEPYKNIPHGTLFINLNPLSFNYSVRKAFSSNTIPEIDEKNPELTDEIYDLAKSLFPEFMNNFAQYIYKVKKAIYEIKENNLKIYKKGNKLIIYRNLILGIFIIILLIVCVSYLIVFMNPKDDFYKNSFRMITVAIILTTGINFTVTQIIDNIINKKHKFGTQNINEIQKDMLKIGYDIILIEKSLKNQNQPNYFI